MSPLIRLLRVLIRETTIVGLCLAAGLTLRFLWMRSQGVISYAAPHWPYVYESANAWLNWILIGVPLNLMVSWVGKRFSQWSTLPSSWTRSLLLALSFSGLILVSWVLGIYSDLALVAIPLAWCFGIVVQGAAPSWPRPRSSAKRLSIGRPLQLLIDSLVIGLSLWMAYLFRFDGYFPVIYRTQFLLILPYIVALQICINYITGTYSIMWRFIALSDLWILIKSAILSLVSILSARYILFQYFDGRRIPLGIIAVHSLLSLVGLLSVRIGARMYYGYAQKKRSLGAGDRSDKRILVVGAGQAGQLLIRELANNPNTRVVGFLDDDPRKLRRVISGVKVLGPTSDLVPVLRRNKIDEVILSMPTAPKSVLRTIISRCEGLGVKILSVPSLSDIVLGKVAITRLRPVKMEDLLGRDSISFANDDSRLCSCFGGRRILITGAAGSIGSELVRQLKEWNPERLILLDQDETGLYEIGMEIRESFPDGLVEFIADVRDSERIRRVFERERPQVVFHAAAYKHVPMMESHPGEAVLNNVVGTRNAARLAAEFFCETFVLISTDKAVNPSSIMGATKRLAEMVIQQLARQHPSIRFCAVRFGNVLGSRGSVVPIFQRQIAEGKDITVTDPEVRRFFMSIPEAVQLVIQAGSLGRHGEIFVLDMGEPIKIVDLARDLIEKSGLKLGQDIKIRFTGLRPGEKLTEELLIANETGMRHTEYPKVFVAQPVEVDWTGISELLAHLESAAKQGDEEGIDDILTALNIGFLRQSSEAEAARRSSLHPMDY